MNKIVTIADKQYHVIYVPKIKIYPAFGNSYENVATVREDLPPRIRNFVEAHELYHCIDTATWGGWIGREVRANFFPGLKDPIGLFATIFATIFNLDRIRLYIRRTKEGF